MNLETRYEAYGQMLYLRLVEEAIAKVYSKQQIKTPVHLYIGQEAIAVGVSLNLVLQDRVMSNHRSHGHTLAKGLDLKGFFAELYGKASGVSRGYGGSMHLVDMDKGILGTSAIVAGGIPIGAGSALAQQLENKGHLTVIYFGDGAVDEGVFWETVNFASLKQLPLLFVMEDNLYASQTHSAARHGYRQIADIVAAYNLPVQTVDGNDIDAVYSAAQEAVAHIRSGHGPYFIDAKTFRWMGHVGPVDDSFTGYRSQAETDSWIARCPIKQLGESLAAEDPLGFEARDAALRADLQQRIEEAIRYGEEAPYAMD